MTPASRSFWVSRKLLREFAVFYRRTLEDSADLIVFAREMEQTKRYFTFEVARFGADRVEMEMRIDPRVEDMLVPPFLLQPLVENAVRHAMPSEGKLTIEVTGEVTGNDVIVRVCDNGVGMTEEARCNILHPESSLGLGIAVIVVQTITVPANNLIYTYLLREGALDQRLAARLAALVVLDLGCLVHGRDIAAPDAAQRLRRAPARRHGQQGCQREFDERLHDGLLHG